VTEDPPPPSLSHHAGAIALGTGMFFVATDLGRWPLLGNRLALAADPLLIAVNAAYFFAFVGLMIALIAVHGRLAVSLGRFGLVAFVAAVVGVMTQGGNMWFDGFAVPWLAQAWPPVFTTSPGVSLQIGGLLSYVLFALGWVLYGLAALRARALPVVLSLGLVVGGVLGYNSGLPPYGTPIGLAVAALGAWLLHQDRAAARARTQNSRTETQNSRA
jgi:hypothetical protein